MQTDCLVRLKLREDVTFSVSRELIKFQHGRGSFTIEAPSESAVMALRILAESGETSENIRARFLECDDVAGWLALKSLLEHISSLLLRSIEFKGVCLATFVPLASGVSKTSQETITGPYVLSRFAYFRRIGSTMALECPLGRARIIFEDPRSISVAYQLSQPQMLSDLERANELELEVVQQLVSLLLEARALTLWKPDEGAAEDVDSALASWEFHDLLFQSRSRLGRQDSGYGGTYRFSQKRPAPPALRPHADGGEIIILQKPDIDRMLDLDPPFGKVLEQRRSIRRFGVRPISIDSLSEFLFRVARVKRVFQPDAENQELLFRNYPAGGAIHELEIYPVINRCEGLDAGIYRYDAAKHALVKIADRNKRVSALLSMAGRTLKQDEEPQVLLVITARFQRVQWKYESMAYALILKNVGVLYQTMYLAATAMGLAPCALGGGDSDLFSSAASLNYYSETSVGEFVLGSRGTGATPLEKPYSEAAASTC